MYGHAEDRTVRIDFDGKTLITRCLVARSFWRRFMGFMGRRSISDDEGILFPHCNSIHTLFMRLTIDVFYLGENGEVIEVFSHLKPWRLLFPIRGVKHVLETAAGTAQKLGIRKGHRLGCEEAWG